MTQFIKICQLSDLIENAGIPALLGQTPIALYYVKGQVFALDNFDPIGEASVMSRGIIGSIKGELVVASPLYKQHFNLQTGVCVEQPDVSIAVYAVELRGTTSDEADDTGEVWVKQP